MATIEAGMRPELLKASDAVIEDAVGYADPMVLRGLLYQLTGDPEIRATAVQQIAIGHMERMAPAGESEIALLRRKAVDFLKTYRDAGAGQIGFGPPERLQESLDLTNGAVIADEDRGMAMEELALDPWARALKWQSPPDPARLEAFSVTVIGTGMGGLDAALKLKRAGIPCTIFEKNEGVGGTWFENRYPGARVDSPSRLYSHIYGVDFHWPYMFAPQAWNQLYFDWVADEYDLRKDVVFNTEVRALTWDEASAMWEIETVGPEGRRTHRSNAVITSVGFLNRPNMPDIEGMETFDGPSWHTGRWPEGFDPKGKRVAVIGTGCTGYQMVPELARDAAHVTVFQRTPQWLVAIPGYLGKMPEQVNWLDRNMPYHSNFMRFRTSFGTSEDWTRMTAVDPDFDDPHSCSATNKLLRDNALQHLHDKLGDRKLGERTLVEIMTPKHPVWSARAVLVDLEYNILDALQADNVTLVTDGVGRINARGVEDVAGIQHDVDVIIYATGFKANEYLYPMAITGRDGRTLDQLWAKDGARAYVAGMMPGFPNLWTIYGPNTNGGLQVAAIHEMTTAYALQCMEKLILEGRDAIEVKDEAYWRFSTLVDEQNLQRVWSDPRAHSYYWTQHGRSAGMNPLSGRENWHYLHRPDFADMDVR